VSSLIVRHNIEVAHRLYESIPGDKCENIHGHSMLVELAIHGHVDSKGLLEGLSFGEVKRSFRGYLDEWFDHHLLLNGKDPLAGFLATKSNIDAYYTEGIPQEFWTLPGLQDMDGDPTTENIAKWIAEWCTDTFHLMCDVTVHETAVNAAKVCAKPNGGTNAS